MGGVDAVLSTSRDGRELAGDDPLPRPDGGAGRRPRPGDLETWKVKGPGGAHEHVRRPGDLETWKVKGPGGPPRSRPAAMAMPPLAIRVRANTMALPPLA